MPRTQLWATVMNAIRTIHTREAVQAEGVCHCAGNDAVAPGIILMGRLGTTFEKSQKYFLSFLS